MLLNFIQNPRNYLILPKEAEVNFEKSFINFNCESLIILIPLYAKNAQQCDTNYGLMKNKNKIISKMLDQVSLHNF